VKIYNSHVTYDSTGSESGENLILYRSGFTVKNPTPSSGTVTFSLATPLFVKWKVAVGNGVCLILGGQLHLDGGCEVVGSGSLKSAEEDSELVFYLGGPTMIHGDDDGRLVFDSDITIDGMNGEKIIFDEQHGIKVTAGNRLRLRNSYISISGQNTILLENTAKLVIENSVILLQGTSDNPVGLEGDVEIVGTVKIIGAGKTLRYIFDDSSVTNFKITSGSELIVSGSSSLELCYNSTQNLASKSPLIMDDDTAFLNLSEGKLATTFASTGTVSEIYLSGGNILVDRHGVLSSPSEKLVIGTSTSATTIVIVPGGLLDVNGKVVLT